jgi:ribosome-associated translation inhibitor RaiA
MSSSNTKPPYYIVGLPTDSIEGQEAQTKFERLSTELFKVYPFIEEIRAVVKAKKTAKAHPRWEVSVEVYTPKEVHAFSETGHDIVVVFDSLGPKMKRMLTSKKSRVTASHGDSPRKVAS